MARKKPQMLALRWGHPTAFRKTVVVGGTKEEPEKVQLVFEPGVKYRLSSNEVEQLQRFIDSGLLVDPGADVKKRYVDCEEVNSASEQTPEPEPEAVEA